MKREWKNVRVGDRVWKFVMYSARSALEDSSYFLECEAKNEPYTEIRKISHARVSIQVDFISSTHRLKPEVLREVEKVMKKWVEKSKERHPSVWYRMGWGRTFNYFDVDPMFLDAALEEFAQIVLNPKNWIEVKPPLTTFNRKGDVA